MNNLKTYTEIVFSQVGSLLSWIIVVGFKTVQPLGSHICNKGGVGSFFGASTIKSQGFSNILESGTPFRGKQFPRTPLIFITVIEHKVNV